MLEIPLDPDSRVPLYLQIAEHIERLVESGALAPGARLPSSRELSFTLGVSRMTVSLAYDTLEDRLRIRKRGRSGAFVTGGGTSEPLMPSQGEGQYDMDSGIPSSDLVPVDALASLARKAILERGASSLQMTPPQGIDELRFLLVKHAVSRGIPAQWNNILVTSGGRQGLYIAAAALSTVGVGKMWMEELTYPDAWGIANGAGMTVHALPSGGGHLWELPGTLGPCDVLYLVPSFQNPTGRTIPMDVRRKILDESLRRGFFIIEDDAYGELRFGETSVPALAAMEGAERVLYLGSFSQVLFPGLRIGYSLVPTSLVPHVLAALATHSGPVSTPVQLMTASFIASGGLERALSDVRQSMQARMRSLSEALDRYMPEYRFDVPGGGIYLWLPTNGRRSDEAARAAGNEGVLVSPGRAFHLSGIDPFAVRLSISSVPAVRMGDAVRRLRAAWETSGHSLSR
jgi:GntR family transcriptional regulator/MocR family aminotransferase